MCLKLPAQPGNFCNLPIPAVGYKGIRKVCRNKHTSGMTLDAANPQTTGDFPYPLKAWEVLRDAKAPRWPRRGVFASRANMFEAEASDDVTTRRGPRRGLRYSS